MISYHGALQIIYQIFQGIWIRFHQESLPAVGDLIVKAVWEDLSIVSPGLDKESIFLVFEKIRNYFCLVILTLQIWIFVGKIVGFVWNWRINNKFNRDVVHKFEN